MAEQGEARLSSIGQLGEVPQSRLDNRPSAHLEGENTEGAA